MSAPRHQSGTRPNPANLAETRYPLSVVLLRGRGTDRIGDLRRNSDGFTPAKRGIRKLIAERQAFDQFSDDEMKIVCLPDFVNRDYIRML